MNFSRRVVVGMAVAVAAALPALAHHSAAEWDMTKRISISGTAKVVQFRNPHGHLELSVTDAKGAVVNWDVETSAMNLLMRRGWTPGRIKIGDKITITGHPHKSQPARLYMREIRLSDGTVFGDPTGQDKALD